MKSKRAEEFINNRSELIDGLEWMVDASTARRAVELAEQDAEEKIEMLKARAVCAFDSLDFTELMTAECVQDFDNVECRLRGLFIQKLNER
jgi:hypothetical protein